MILFRPWVVLTEIGATRYCRDKRRNQNSLIPSTIPIIRDSIESGGRCLVTESGELLGGLGVDLGALGGIGELSAGSLLAGVVSGTLDLAALLKSK